MFSAYRFWLPRVSFPPRCDPVDRESSNDDRSSIIGNVAVTDRSQNLIVRGEFLRLHASSRQTLQVIRRAGKEMVCNWQDDIRIQCPAAQACLNLRRIG